MALAQAFVPEDCTKELVRDRKCPIVRKTQTNGVSFAAVRFWVCSVDLHRLRLQLTCCPYQQKAPAPQPLPPRHLYSFQQYFMSGSSGFSTTCRLARDEPSLTSIKANPSTRVLCVPSLESSATHQAGISAISRKCVASPYHSAQDFSIQPTTTPSPPNRTACQKGSLRLPQENSWLSKLISMASSCSLDLS